MLFVLCMQLSAKILILNNEGIIEKIFYEPMGRKTKRAFLWLCPEKRRKKEFVHLRVKVTLVLFCII